MDAILMETICRHPLGRPEEGSSVKYMGGIDAASMEYIRERG
jgi:hypothetical protein